MLNFPAKRFRRNHRYQLPVCNDCHAGPDGIHGIGSEATWLESMNRTPEEAIAYVLDLRDKSQEAEL